jgi:fatty acid desaturase
MTFSDAYRSFHLKHHKHMGLAADPELAHKTSMAANWELPLSKARMIRLLLGDLLGLNFKEMLTIYKTIGAPRSKTDVAGPLCWWVTVISILLITIGPEYTLKLVGLWTVSIWTVFLASFRLRLWTEHLGTDGVYKIYAGPVARFFFLPHTTWHHFEHHQDFTVPFWALHKIRENNGVESIGNVFNRLGRTL